MFLNPGDSAPLFQPPRLPGPRGPARPGAGRKVGAAPTAHFLPASRPGSARSPRPPSSHFPPAKLLCRESEMRPGHRKERAEGSGRGVSDRCPSPPVCGLWPEGRVWSQDCGEPHSFSILYVLHLSLCGSVLGPVFAKPLTFTGEEGTGSSAVLGWAVALTLDHIPGTSESLTRFSKDCAESTLNQASRAGRGFGERPHPEPSQTLVPE